ncbi:cupin domain-containing protein [Aerobium aerolatum]|uniref:Cupin domain-containing protein n=1 Tax=Aquamicrobium aerolatum DSM 21857 TaxID=1121003 RepID=A0A1I3SXQ6_9HYPH|nr:Cupin domain-containing protein [Aquamicrobium aerolatum DSM 21857]
MPLSQNPGPPLSGAADFDVGEERLHARNGDVVIVPAHMPHRFTNSGDEILAMVCIHASGRIVQQFLCAPDVDLIARAGSE